MPPSCTLLDLKIGRNVDEEQNTCTDYKCLSIDYLSLGRGGQKSSNYSVKNQLTLCTLTGAQSHHRSWGVDGLGVTPSVTFPEGCHVTSAVFQLRTQNFRTIMRKDPRDPKREAFYKTKEGYCMFPKCQYHAR